ncbi:hypothetical protein AVEN_194485-1 [Araneus ventricosus]|uniref:Uncharacterized protein n=1 Tax=Araneus ventricosus TaxID=182803 RepID=A0A4Y2A7B7_ARAVE|nr:hypothetical protein AVEN_194485-1 [Araneus ventricosus]
MQRSSRLSITKAYSTTSIDALHVVSGCPPLDLKVRTHVMTSQHIQLIKNSLEIGGLQSFDFEMAREPREVVHERRVIINEVKENIREYLGDTQLIWIRAHRGFEGNKRADQLAKMASTKDRVDFSLCLSRIQIKNATRREILEAWQQRWSGSSNARWTYSLLSKVDHRRIYGDFFLNQVFTWCFSLSPGSLVSQGSPMSV